MDNSKAHHRGAFVLACVGAGVCLIGAALALGSTIAAVMMDRQWVALLFGWAVVVFATAMRWFWGKMRSHVEQL